MSLIANNLAVELCDYLNSDLYILINLLKDQKTTFYFPAIKKI